MLQIQGVHPAPPTDWTLSLLVGGIGVVLIVAFVREMRLRSRPFNGPIPVASSDFWCTVCDKAQRWLRRGTAYCPNCENIPGHPGNLNEREAGRISA